MVLVIGSPLTLTSIYVMQGVQVRWIWRQWSLGCSWFEAISSLWHELFLAWRCSHWQQLSTVVDKTMKVNVVHRIRLCGTLVNKTTSHSVQTSQHPLTLCSVCCSRCWQIKKTFFVGLAFSRRICCIHSLHHTQLPGWGAMQLISPLLLNLAHICILICWTRWPCVRTELLSTL